MWVAAALVCEAFVTLAPAMASDLRWPWAPGDNIAGCAVEACEVHPEFQRCRLRCGPAETGVELAAADPLRPSTDWSSARFLLQPAPGALPPEHLMLALRDRLRAWDGAGTAVAQQPLAARSSAAGPAWSAAEAALLAAAALAILGAVALAVAAWSPAQVTRASTPVALGLAVAAGVCVALQTLGLPLAWLTSLHEGTTSANVALLYGHNLHAGPLYAAIVHLCANGNAVSVRDLATTNASAAAGLLATAVSAAAVARQLPWAVAIAALATVPVVQLVAWSEAEVATATLFVAAALPALFVLGRAGPVHDRRTVAALSHLCLCTALAGLCRTEMAGFGLTALAWHGARLVRGDNDLRGGFRRVSALCRRHRVPATFAVLAILASAWPVNERVDPGARWTWLLAGAHPLNPTVLAAPALALAVLPVPLCALAALGLVRLLRHHLWAWGWVAVAAVVLFRVWFAASHRVLFEMLRYGLGLLPVAVGLCGLGAVELCERVQRWRPLWPRQAALLIVAAAAGGPLWIAPAQLVWPVRQGGLDDLPFLDRDQQAEVRSLTENGHRFDGCVWLTAVHPARERTGAGAQTGWLAFGPPLRGPRQLQPTSNPVTALRGLAPSAPCGLLYRGLDCHLVQGPDCDRLERGRQPLWISRRPARIYSDPREYGQLQPDLTLAVFRLW